MSKPWKNFSFLFLLISQATMTAPALGAGVWVRNYSEMVLTAARKFYEPDFYLVKTAVFHYSGRTRLSQTYSHMLSSCGRKESSYAWLGHRISDRNPPTEKAGEKLGTDLTVRLRGTCLKGIELDMEPLPKPTSWLPPFLKGLRKTLDPELSIFLDIPPVTDRKIVGLSWTPANAKAMIQHVDGLQIMIYDSGPKNAPEFQKLILENFAFAATVTKEAPKKSVVLGLPAYYDVNRKNHPLDIENLKVTWEALQKLPKETALSLCEKRVRLAYYAGWTFTKDDERLFREIDQWEKKLCKSTKGET